MYYQMLSKATALLRRYGICHFPVPLEIIDTILADAQIQVETTPHLVGRLKGHAVDDGYEKVIYLAENLLEQEARDTKMHEYCHLTNHHGNCFNLYLKTRDKNENQARAFAAYFLMPLGIFERQIKLTESNHELAETFGVPEDLVVFRKELLANLLESGYYYPFEEKGYVYLPFDED